MNLEASFLKDIEGEDEGVALHVQHLPKGEREIFIHNLLVRIH
jgi:hypothetical protein